MNNRLGGGLKPFQISSSNILKNVLPMFPEHEIALDFLLKTFTSSALCVWKPPEYDLLQR